MSTIAILKPKQSIDNLLIEFKRIYQEHRIRELLKKKEYFMSYGVKKRNRLYVRNKLIRKINLKMKKKTSR